MPAAVGLEVARDVPRPVGALSGEGLVQGHPQGVQVAAVIDLCPSDLLGGHVGIGAHHVTQGRQQRMIWGCGQP